MLGNAAGFARHLDGFDHVTWVVAHEYHIRRFDGGITANATHGNPHIGTCQYRRVIDAIADKGYHAVTTLYHGFYTVDFVCRQQVAVDIAHMKLLRQLLYHFGAVATQDGGFLYAEGLQCVHGFAHAFLWGILQDDNPKQAFFIG